MISQTVILSVCHVSVCLSVRTFTFRIYACSNLTQIKFATFPSCKVIVRVHTIANTVLPVNHFSYLARIAISVIKKTLWIGGLRQPKGENSV